MIDVKRISELKLVDAIEAEFDRCDHPYATELDHPWCNVCGACTIAPGVWIKPHWRDILVRAIVRLIDG